MAQEHLKSQEDHATFLFVLLLPKNQIQERI